MFQLILPFQLELPFEAGGVPPGTTGKQAGNKARTGLDRMPRPKRVRGERGRCTFSLELPMGLSVGLAEGDA